MVALTLFSPNLLNRNAALLKKKKNLKPFQCGNIIFHVIHFPIAVSLLQ